MSGAKPKVSRSNSFLKRIGPGLITGASDDDPSGIATYSQVGARYGYAMLWTMLFSFPLMAAVQEISGRIGRVSGKGIAANMRDCFPLWLVISIVLLLGVANVANLAADIGAMGSVIGLLTGHPSLFYMSALGLMSLFLEVYIPYTRYVSFLKWLTLALFSYVIAAFTIKSVAWRSVIHNTLLPSFKWNASYLSALLAILGTTISPYLFFWQASEEAEDVCCDEQAQPLKKDPSAARAQLGRIRFDTYFGMGTSNVVGFFIILMAAATLHAHGETTIATAAQASEALAPLGGRLAFWLFALGIIGTGLLTVPVLAGSTAYATAEIFGWEADLEKKWFQAKPFYAILGLSILLGMALNFFQINPIRALYWSAVLNGIVAGPVLIIIMLIANNPKVMGKFTIPMYLKMTGWLTAFVMCCSTVGLFFPTHK